MYNNETVRRRERGERGGMDKWSRGEEEGETEGGVFHVSPEFERPPFHVSIVIFCLFSFH